MADNTRRWCPPIKLYDNPRDRAIAEWVDRAVKDRRISYSETVKDFLYRLATTGEDENADRLTILGEIARLNAKITQLTTQLASGSYSIQEAPEPVEEDTEAQILEKLGRMGT